jgi:hypothetical protein
LPDRLEFFAPLGDQLIFILGGYRCSLVRHEGEIVGLRRSNEERAIFDRNRAF